MCLQIIPVSLVVYLLPISQILLTQLCFMCSEYQVIQRHSYPRAQSQ